MQKIEEERVKKEKFNLPMDVQLVNSFLVLAPVNGIPISEVNVGDLIVTKINNSN